MYVCMHACMHACMHTCMCVYMYMYVYHHTYTWEVKGAALLISHAYTLNLKPF